MMPPLAGGSQHNPQTTSISPAFQCRVAESQQARRRRICREASSSRCLDLLPRIVAMSSSTAKAASAPPAGFWGAAGFSRKSVKSEPISQASSNDAGQGNRLMLPLMQAVRVSHCCSLCRQHGRAHPGRSGKGSGARLEEALPPLLAPVNTAVQESQDGIKAATAAAVARINAAASQHITPPRSLRTSTASRPSPWLATANDALCSSKRLLSMLQLQCCEPSYSFYELCAAGAIGTPELVTVMAVGTLGAVIAAAGMVRACKAFSSSSHQ